MSLAYLKRIAAGELTVETSDHPESTPSAQAASPSPLISARPRSTGCDQDGL
ncbi:MAG: hypothetical protein WCL04_01425 [Verrucomicrobiota bacterium]